MKKFLLLAFALFAFAACSDDANDPAPAPVPGVNDKYQGGFYIYNEGWFGHTPANLCYQAGDKLEQMIFQAANPEMKLGNTGTTAVFTQDHLYLVAKESPNLTEVDPTNLKGLSNLQLDPKEHGQSNSFAVVDKAHGVLTTTNGGAYVVALNPLVLGDQICQGNCTDVCLFNNYILVIRGGKICAFDATTFKLLKEDIAPANTGFALADGAAWAANNNQLVKINNNLEAEIIDLGEINVMYNQWAYTPTGLQAAPTGKTLYFAAENGHAFYKFDVASKTASKIFSAPQGFVTYGAGVAVNPHTGDLYLTLKVDNWTDYDTNIHIVSPDGKQKEVISYDKKVDEQYYYWFPSMILFR